MDDLDAMLDHALFGEPVLEVEAEPPTLEVEELPPEPPRAPEAPRASSAPVVSEPSRTFARHSRRLSVLPSLVAEEEAWLRRMQEERSQQEPTPELLTLTPPPPVPLVVVPTPVPTTSRHPRALMLVALLGPVTLGLALGAVLMRIADQPELTRAAEAPRPLERPHVAPPVASVPTVAVSVPTVAVSVPPVASVPTAAVSVPPAPVSAVSPPPQPPAPQPPAPQPPAPQPPAPQPPAPLLGEAPPAPVAVRSVKAGPPAAEVRAPFLAPLRHKREPARLPSGSAKARSAPGGLSDKDFDRAMDL